MEEKKFFDFKSSDKFNLNEEYSKLFGDNKFKPVNEAENKLKDAESIIDELGAIYVENLSLQNYENGFINLTQFLNRFSVELDEVKNMTKEDRDKLFGYGKALFEAYQNLYSQLCFNFELSQKEWHFIDHTLSKKLLYNGQEVFNYQELLAKFIEPTRVLADQSKQLDSFVPICSIQSLILLSHLLMKHEEKGSGDSFHHFRNVLVEIAKMTKLFNAYGVMLERVSNDFNNWINALEVLDEFVKNTNGTELNESI